MKFDAQFLENAAKGTWNKVCKGVDGFHFDARLIGVGECFVAIKTHMRDGHQFIGQAKENGAAAAIVEHFDESVDMPQLKVEDTLVAFQQIASAHRKNFKNPVVAVTGSCGKTSTKDLIAHLLGSDKTCVSHKNLNNFLGVPFNLAHLDNELHEFGVFEAGINEPGEMKLLGQIITPDIAVTTNIAPVHLEGLGSLEGIANEKAALHKNTKDSVLLESTLEYEAYSSLEGNNHVVDTQRVLEGYQLPDVSNGMKDNIAIAVKVAGMLGVSKEMVQERLSSWKLPDLRANVLELEGKSVFLDCYNSNPYALKDAYEFFNQKFSKDISRLYLLGCMGELGAAAASFHCQLGAAIKLNEGDRVIVLGPHADDFKQGFISQGIDPLSIISNLDRCAILEYIKDFKGNVFVKGSNVYKLWEFFQTPKELTTC